MLACVGGTVYPSPAAAPLKDAAVLAEDGKLTMVEAGARFKLPASAHVLDRQGKFIVAGFWNSHVHFENGWQNAAEQRIPVTVLISRDGKVCGKHMGLASKAAVENEIKGLL